MDDARAVADSHSRSDRPRGALAASADAIAANQGNSRAMEERTRPPIFCGGLVGARLRSSRFSCFRPLLGLSEADPAAWALRGDLGCRLDRPSLFVDTSAT